MLSLYSVLDILPVLLVSIYLKRVGQTLFTALLIISLNFALLLPEQIRISESVPYVDIRLSSIVV